MRTAHTRRQYRTCRTDTLAYVGTTHCRRQYRLYRTDTRLRTKSSAISEENLETDYSLSASISIVSQWHSPKYREQRNIWRESVYGLLILDVSIDYIALTLALAQRTAQYAKCIFVKSIHCRGLYRLYHTDTRLRTGNSAIAEDTVNTHFSFPTSESIVSHWN